MRREADSWLTEAPRDQEEEKSRKVHIKGTLHTDNTKRQNVLIAGVLILERPAINCKLSYNCVGTELRRQREGDSVEGGLGQ